MKKILIWFFISFFLLSAGQVEAKKQPKTVRAEGGTSIEGFGFAIDASYEKKLDKLIPGYRILNVAIVNNSFQILFMNPDKDRWSLKTKAGKKFGTIVNLSKEDPKAWEQIPKRVKNHLSYPLAIPIGAHLAFDLFVPEKVPLEKMRELEVVMESLGTTFRIEVSPSS
ncbi:MAG: hypothetical protein A3I05_06510 [Deltaproteobacteria bacterium RIFCSPLOWO2_02_FULL_44_10]|nr:MAG: hypothetical protein A3C46_06715 [Deltaproteobacteria bacterium RIFCSPHIGHO2_02_FULL_44_16]OGQ46688.1 MAG: hypothetical protein A3I05_06510 [Deltaproteobacteria bacterium RIFCSPLOWO2_02_FULL_44_10]